MKLRRRTKRERCACGCLRTVVEEAPASGPARAGPNQRLFAAIPICIAIGFAAVAWALPQPEAGKGDSRDSAEAAVVERH